MAPLRRRVQLVPAVAVASALLAGCGDDRPPPTIAEVRAAQRAVAYPLYWAGTSVDGLPLTNLITMYASPTVSYGTCKASSDSGCSLPVSIQTDAICDRNALFPGGAPSSSGACEGSSRAPMPKGRCGSRHRRATSWGEPCAVEPRS